jgi:hypothetical protein
VQNGFVVLWFGGRESIFLSLILDVMPFIIRITEFEG